MSDKVEQEAKRLLLELDPVVPNVDHSWQDNWTLPHPLSKDVRDLGWLGALQSKYVKGLVEWMSRLVTRLAAAEEWKIAIGTLIQQLCEKPGFNHDWAGDKHGWGFNFEWIKWVQTRAENAEAKLDFLKSKGLTVGSMKDQHGERLMYVIEPESELCDLATLRKLTDAEIERDRLLALACRVVEIFEPMQAKGQNGHTFELLLERAKKCLATYSGSSATATANKAQ